MNMNRPLTTLSGATRASARARRLGAAVLGLGIAALALAGGPARAGSIAFDYGSLSNGASNSQIQSFMNTQLGSAGSVAVTGAIANNNYTGDGHVTGPVNNGTVTSDTLASTDGTVIMNNNGVVYNPSGEGTSSAITMTFTGLTISSIRFDFEIFPDGTCPSLSNCGTNHANRPEMTVLANGTQVVQYFAQVPGSNGTSNGFGASTYTHSPNSGRFSTEQAPQLLGFGATLTLPADTTTLEFADWPSTIAIDNLTINTPDSPVPEPASLTLFGTALLGFGLIRRYRNAARR